VTRVAVVGGGPAGLMAAEVVSGAGVDVTIFERMPSVGRKFLMAGRGGLNLTHSEDLEVFLGRYRAGREALRPAIEALHPEAVRQWSSGLGQETFVGSSGRVFPKSMKASPLLRAWLRRLGERGVAVETRHCWQGWDEAGCLLFDTLEGARSVAAEATVLALGGGSWARLGSDGGFVEILRRIGVDVVALRAANCGFLVDWSEAFRERFQGVPLKRVALRFDGQGVRGEALITATGIEGGAVYGLSAPLREAIAQSGRATVIIDLRPDLEEGDLLKALQAPRKKQSLSTFLRKAARLSPVAIGLLHEAALSLPQALGQLAPGELARLIKNVPVHLTATAPIERAISTAGGVAFSEIDADFMLKRRPGVFVAGEMLDWEAPTGGYLLQATLATGAAAGRGVLKWLADRP
jgi:uncharacterized flavoprotein (TIGR03862 family)